MLRFCQWREAEVQLGNVIIVGSQLLIEVLRDEGLDDLVEIEESVTDAHIQNSLVEFVLPVNVVLDIRETMQPLVSEANLLFLQYQ